MKKLIIFSICGALFAASTALGQVGYFTLGGDPHYVWDTTIAPTFDTNFEVGFLMAPAGKVPLLYSIVNGGTPTNNAPGLGGYLPYSYATAWSDIESDPNFKIATIGATAVTVSGAANGSFLYNSGLAVPLDNTISDTAYSLVVIAWNTDNGQYNSLASAEAADAPVGWSSVISYTPGQAFPSLPPPAPIAVTQFGVGYDAGPVLALVSSLGTGGTGGSFTLTVSGSSYRTVVQVSTNLVDWVGISTNTPPFSFTDSPAAAFPYLFYRAVQSQ
jgi:hypothetical protein